MDFLFGQIFLIKKTDDEGRTLETIIVSLTNKLYIYICHMVYRYGSELKLHIFKQLEFQAN